jgi:tetratricopeptide (TPR) repeat protein
MATTLKYFANHPVRKIVSVCISFLLVGVFVQNFRQQLETKRQLAEMRQMLAGAVAAPPSMAAGKSNSIVLDGGNGGSETVRRQHNLEMIVTAGWKLVDQRRPDVAAQAAQMFREGIANVDSRSPELYNGLGRALLVSGDPRGAVAAWRKGLALAPTFSDMQSGIGWAYWCLGDPSRAKGAWQKALVLNPHSVDAWSAMAWIDLALGKCAEAKSGFQELVQYDAKRKSWTIGLAMAQGGNTDVREIAQFFLLPPLGAFDRPMPVDPADASSQVASNP